MSKKNDVEKNPKLMEALAAINKAKPGSINFASRVAFSHLKRLPSGVFSLDMAIGGGFPRGRIVMVVGEESSAKTSLFLLLAGNIQHTCKACSTRFEGHTEEVLDAKGEVTAHERHITRDCACGKNEPHVVALFDAEGHFDPNWAASLGVDVPTLIIVQPENAEAGVDQVTTLMRTGELDLVGIDSVAMLTPGREIEQGAEGGQRPDLALIMNRAMRNFQAALNSLGMDHPNKPALYMINQFREKVGVMYGDPRTWPGGKGQNFAASIILSMRQGKAVDEKGSVGGKDDNKVGAEFFFRTEKNKTFPPYKKGSFIMYNQDVPGLGVRKGEINNFDQMVRYGLDLGVFKKSGSWIDLSAALGDDFKNPAAKNGMFQGADALLAYLKTLDAGKVRQVETVILDAVKATNTGATAPAAA